MVAKALKALSHRCELCASVNVVDNLRNIISIPDRPASN